MSNKLINKDKLNKAAIESRDEEKMAKYAGASYFREKDKKAKKFLKDHPVPAKFLQR
ncbi:MAG: hypothetical protein KF746_13640 [Chitinophagaceae bacterium]|nr:hypothetical protein [Chitinophagaceae bacterium]MBX3254263.1 hypothetical protein [Chitinophagaceae bacterium]